MAIKILSFTKLERQFYQIETTNLLDAEIKIFNIIQFIVKYQVH